MRKILSLLLALLLLSSLGLCAFAQEAVEDVSIEGSDSGGEISLDDDPGLDLSGLSIPDVGEPELIESLELTVQEDVQSNASVPTQLTLGVKEKYTLKLSNVKKYESSNPKYATVSKKGVITGKEVGKATITATLKSGKTHKVKVTVKKKPTSVKLNKEKLTLQAGDSYQLKAKLSKDSASKLTWKSSKASVAKVSDSGEVTALKAGSAKITVTTYNGLKATCALTVKPAARKVGVSMPTDEFVRWERDGANLKAQLQKAGFNVDLKYAALDGKKQRAQIEAMIEDGCEVLIIAPVDSSALGSALNKAAEKGVKVVAYDRLITDSKNVDYYVTFDNYQVGVVQANYIKKALKLDSAKGPFNIEFTAGDSDDWNAKLFFDGAMNTLKPYLKSGKLKVISGQTDFGEVATQYWASDNARTRAEEILSAYYPKGTTLHAWLCSNDSTAVGVIEALDAKYSGSWPVITGQDCDIQNVKYIIQGKQAMSVFKDTDALVKQTVKMTKQILKGQKVSVNDTKSYDNGAKVVPAYLCTPIAVTKSNYRKVLIESGIYPEDWF